MKKTMQKISIICIAFLCILFQGCSVEKDLTAEELYELASPSVVEITGQTASGSITGSGFFYDNNGTIITNYHVIDKCSSLSITLSDGSTYDVTKVLGYSTSQDLAILETTCSDSIPLKIRTTTVKTGETVYAIGSSLGLSGSLSDGIISSAEREIDGYKFIQTTAPISQGNSGGPLLDSKGYVIGITTASFTDGQNLNIAIPVQEIDNISTAYPQTLASMFPQTVEWLSERDFFYYADYDKYALVFQLSDEDQVAMSSSGTIKMKIVNDDGTTVYSHTKTFSSSDFETWTYGDSTDKFLASIYIDPSDITPSTSATGKVYFTVSGNGYSFEESTITATDLPTLGVQVELPSTPQTLNYISYNGSPYTTVRIDSITYEIMYDDCLYIYFSGEKLYDNQGNNSTSSCPFRWKLYDSEGYLVTSGVMFIPDLVVGDKFKNEADFALDCIKPGGSYKIVITDY